jgi:hypothetical protein
LCVARQDVVMFKLQRAIDKKQAALDFSSCRLHSIPSELKALPDPGQITDVNLAYNKLFNGKRRACP